MFLRHSLKGFDHGLFFRIIFINIFSVLLVVIFMIMVLFREYRIQERELVREKLLKYWILENNSESNSQTNSLIERTYIQDIDVSNVEYAIRITDVLNNPMLYLFPTGWSRYNMYNLVFPTKISERGDRLLVRPSSDSNSEDLSTISVYSIKTGERIIQILISSENRIDFIKHTANNGLTAIFLVTLLSSIASVIILSSVTLPIYRINILAEDIIKKQHITQRLQRKKSKNKKSEVIRLEKNINEMLDTIERLVKRLQIANISLGHDIRTPLTHIRNHCEELLSNKPNKKTKEKLLACVKATKDIQHLAQYMLAISEIDSSLVKIPETPVFIDEVLENVIEMYEYIAEDRKIVFEKNIEKGIKLHIAKTWIRQLIGNLLDNAMKFTSCGKKVVLNVSTNPVGQVCLVVADEGVGISEDDIPHIWNAAWKKEKSKHNSTHSIEDLHGYGFGLSIVKNIVSAYRGNITVHSTLGYGSVFTVKFKL